MKKIIGLALLFASCISVQAQEKKLNADYDAKLAKQFGADDYGMKMYILVMLKTGTNLQESKAKTDSLFAGHMENMGKLVEINKLIVAGPLSKNDKNYRGIFILNTNSIKEAEELLATDPAIKAKLLDADLFSWYGSAALAEYLKIADKVGKYKF
ncbi:hypothetical protein FQZ97_836350 [compost metagenome]